MYLFFLIFFIGISLSLIFLILLQSGKGFNNISNLNVKNNIKCFNGIGKNNFISNIIGIFSFLFLVTSIILCNINNKKMEPDFFWENDIKKTVYNKSTLDKELLNSDIPH